MTSGWLGIIRGVLYSVVTIGSAHVLAWAGTTGWFTAAGMLVITGAVAWLDHTVTGTQTAGMARRG